MGGGGEHRRQRPVRPQGVEARSGRRSSSRTRTTGGRSQSSRTPSASSTSDALAKSLPAYENNELDSAQVSAGDYDRVLNDPKLSKELKGYPLSQTNMIHCDATNKPTSDVRVRNALSLAFDREPLINNVLKKYYLKAATILPPDIAGYNPQAALTGGVEKAKQLMADAGFPNGQGFPSDFTVVYSTGCDHED